MMMCTFSEAQTKTCSNVDGDDSTANDAFDCGTVEAKLSDNTCTGDCVHENCCGIIIIIIIMVIIVYGLFVFSLENTDTVLMTCLINMLTYTHHTTSN